MIDLVIIGNGFDLAHNFPTTFSDFLKWYFDKIKNTPNSFFTNYGTLFKIAPNSNINSTDFVDLNYNSREIEFSHDFIQNLVYKHKSLYWEGIEREYFNFLLLCESETHVEELNNCFEELRLNFIEYLKAECKVETFFRDDVIYNHLKSIIINSFNSQTEEQGQVIWLNFNYTGLAEFYFDKFSAEIKEFNSFSKFIYIHGTVQDKSSVIFGYGDESDPKYPIIEQKNNSYLKYFKSFMYLIRDNYSNLINSLIYTNYRVHIMGHSCGLSDRVLLKEIFCKKECEEIIIYYYKNKDTKQNDFTDKVMNISRVFTLDEKSNLRIKIRSYKRCQPLS